MEQRAFLRKQMLKKTREQIEEKFAGKEIHIIKAVNLLIDLDSINNLMSENINEWKIRQPTGNALNEYTNLEKNTQNVLEEKEKLIKFIEKEMEIEFPNFSILATPIIGAKLLASSGSKKKLCFSPSSTIQILGAEKALFNHIKHKAKCPKHGHLFNHPLLQKLPKEKRGKAARTLAGKLSIALKQDYFTKEKNEETKLENIEKIINKIAQEKEKPKKIIQNFNNSTNTKHKTFTPEERKAYFEKINKEKQPQQNSYNKNNYAQNNYNKSNNESKNNNQKFQNKNNDQNRFDKKNKFKFKKFKKN